MDEITQSGSGEKDGLIRRKDARHRVLKAATVAFNHKNSTLNCVVRNLSPGGARLKVEGLFRPPHAFDLLIPADHVEVECEVVWRRDAELGVKFVSPIREMRHHL